MNVQKISKFIFIATFVFGFFSYSHNAFADVGEAFSFPDNDHMDIVFPFSLSAYSHAADTFHVYFETGGTGLYPSTANIFNGGACNNAWTYLYCTLVQLGGTDGGGGNIRLPKGTITSNNFSDNYWLRFYDSTTGTIYYWAHFTQLGGILQQGSGEYSGIPPTPNISDFIISTSTATARVKGYWKATTTPYVSQRLSFWQESASLGKESYEQVIATTTGNFDFTFDFRDPYTWSSSESSTTPLYSNFTLYASLDQYDETNYVFPFGGTEIVNLDATSTNILTSEYNASDFTSTPRDLALYPEYDCDITHLMGCIKNALIWTFYPTQDALDSWTSLKTTLETKAPFGYFYSVKNAVGGLSATSTPSFSLTIPAHLKTYFFDPFDIGISGILWFFFIFHFYKRLKHIQI
jgi:hypothetical protein